MVVVILLSCQLQLNGLLNIILAYPTIIQEEAKRFAVSWCCKQAEHDALHSADAKPYCDLELGPGILVLYTYHESPRATRNLRFFLDQTAQDWAVSDECQTGPRPGLELVLVISGHFCSVALPLVGNVQVLQVDNSGTDFGAFTDAFDALGITLDSGLEAQGWRRRYKYFVFIDSSCRGPFLPPYAPMLHWTDPFTSKITEEVKLVGPSIHFIPGVAALRYFACAELVS